MPKLEKKLRCESNYWRNYGNIQFKLNNYEAAINSLNNAKSLSSSPEIYLGLGMCYEKIKKYDNAIINYKQLVLLHPSKFKYRFNLMRAYLKIMIKKKLLKLLMEY
ncbi:MAG: tetratricopeptide repeat protein [Flavobacterium sp.]|nr:tetratricopeptide repeat protein [Flavobacterium sp.]